MARGVGRPGSSLASPFCRGRGPACGHPCERRTQGARCRLAWVPLVATLTGHKTRVPPMTAAEVVTAGQPSPAPFLAGRGGQGRARSWGRRSLASQYRRERTNPGVRAQALGGGCPVRGSPAEHRALSGDSGGGPAAGGRETGSEEGSLGGVWALHVFGWPQTRGPVPLGVGTSSAPKRVSVHGRGAAGPGWPVESSPEVP